MDDESRLDDDPAENSDAILFFPRVAIPVVAYTGARKWSITRSTANRQTVHSINTPLIIFYFANDAYLVFFLVSIDRPAE